MPVSRWLSCTGEAPAPGQTLFCGQYLGGLDMGKSSCFAGTLRDALKDEAHL